ncbi:MAG: metallophosphoesterase [Candidatus Rokuibacteriota bacterium]
MGGIMRTRRGLSMWHAAGRGQPPTPASSSHGRHASLQRWLRQCRPADLVDHNRVPDEMVAFVRRELDRLRQPVVILPGNHDAALAARQRARNLAVSGDRLE